MTAPLKITTWNIEHMSRLFDTDGSDTTKRKRAARRANVAAQIKSLNADILCILEGPRDPAEMTAFCAEDLEGAYRLIEADDGAYGTRGTQYIWFIVKSALAADASLLPVDTYKAFAGAAWDVYYWGDEMERSHRHYRHPQTLVLTYMGERIEFIGLHLKSKFVRGGASAWRSADEDRKQKFIKDALKARIKMTTEAANVRGYIDAKFEQRSDPCVFVLGDLNDGVGKEYFERKYLFFDLLSNLQGDVFFARRFLNHALFDFADDLRWTVKFKDFVDPARNPHILLDHILFTQPLVNGSKPFRINKGAGLVEHEIHELANAGQPGYAHTSDHRPVSVTLSPIVAD